MWRLGVQEREGGGGREGKGGQRGGVEGRSLAQVGFFFPLLGAKEKERKKTGVRGERVKKESSKQIELQNEKKV